jgi:uridylate kinase
MVKYKRVLLKLSGEALKDDASSQILSAEKLGKIAKAVKSLKEAGCDVCIVVGAGNIWRGKLADSIGIEPAVADYMGMLGTVINGMAISSALDHENIPNRVMSSIDIKQCAEPYIYKKGLSHLEKGKVVIFAGGTGNPFFTTDTTAALRAKEMNCAAILMAKNGVDGVYTADPKKDPKAKLIKKITYSELLKENLKVMDSTAVALIRDSNIIIRVFDMGDDKNFLKVVNGEDVGTLIQKGE